MDGCIDVHCEQAQHIIFRMEQTPSPTQQLQLDISLVFALCTEDKWETARVIDEEGTRRADTWHWLRLHACQHERGIRMYHSCSSLACIHPSIHIDEERVPAAWWWWMMTMMDGWRLDLSAQRNLCRCVVFFFFFFFNFLCQHTRLNREREKVRERG